MYICGLFLYFVFHYVPPIFKKLSKGLFIWEPGQDNKRYGTLDKIRQLQSFLHKFVVTFIWSRDVFPSRPYRRNRHSRGNIFQVSTSFQNEKRLALLYFSFKRRAGLFNIIKKKPTKATGKKILPKFTNILKYLYMNSQQQTKKLSKNDLFSVVFWKPC